MFQFMRRIHRRGRQAPSVSEIVPEESRQEDFYMKLATYAESRIGEDSSLEMLAGLADSCVLFRAPESAGLPDRGRTWEALVDSDTGRLNRIAVFLDVAPIDQVVEDFFHHALPVIKRSK